MNKIKIILTGSTGMIGESVLDQCLKHVLLEKILVINRKPTDLKHPKLEEIILADLSNMSQEKEKLQGYDACFFCIGVSSTGMNEETYTKLTYTLTLNFATLLSQINSSMTFCYVSGAGTDSTEKGKSMWARVKGKTENELMKLPFKQVYNFRPSALIPYLQVKPNQTYQSVKYLKWLFVLLRPIFPNYIVWLSDFGKAMINSVLYGYKNQVLESKDIFKLANETTSN
jgi:nucleoside-diphosphate-sugar epimerase